VRTLCSASVRSGRKRGARQCAKTIELRARTTSESETGGPNEPILTAAPKLPDLSCKVADIVVLISAYSCEPRWDLPDGGRGARRKPADRPRWIQMKQS
jgi:hypothetical protein